MPIPIIIALAIAVFLVPFIFIRRLLRRALREVRTGYPEHVRILTDPMANLFGLASLGRRQVRGNGILLMTDSEVYFRMLAPRREIRFSLSAIRSLSTPRGFLGKTKGRALLGIEFTGEDGARDSAAWMVRDLESWLSELASRTGVPVERKGIRS